MLGVRVLLRSIRATGSKLDMVCIVATNVRESTREYFKREGCIVKEVPNIPNPYKASQERRRTFKPRFEFSFNKLYVTNMKKPACSHRRTQSQIVSLSASHPQLTSTPFLGRFGTCSSTSA